MTVGWMLSLIALPGNAACFTPLVQQGLSPWSEKYLQHLADSTTTATLEEFRRALLSGAKWTPEFSASVITHFVARMENAVRSSKSPMNYEVWVALVAVQARWDSRLTTEPSWAQSHVVHEAIQQLTSCFREPAPHDARSEKYYRWGLQLAERLASSY